MVYSNNSKGFTIVELVMVILLVGLLSFSAISLFASRSNYSNFIAKDLLISQGLLAQQIALSNTSTATPVSLTIANTSDSWRFSIQRASGFNPEPVSLESDSNVMQIDGVTLGSGDSQTFTWTNAAVLSDGNDHVIRFVGDNTFSVCLSSQGYIYEGIGGCP